MEDWQKAFYDCGIIPVVVLDDEKDAVPVADALYEGGITAAEITFRTSAAAGSIAAISKRHPDMFVGAGTVLNEEQVDQAIAAGSKFIVAPGTNAHTIAYCQKKGIPFVPGVCTPSDIERALEYGLEYLKFFPAEASGGLKMIKALAGPYVNVSFMPTGGVSPENVRDYLSYEKIFACGGTWLTKKDMIQSGNFEKIHELAEQASSIVKEVRK